jgi:hypothetical protein
VICIIVAVAAIWLNDPENRKRLGNGFC